MIFEYDFDRLPAFLGKMLKDRTGADAWAWLTNEGMAARQGEVGKFNIAFVAMPRRTGKDLLKVSEQDVAQLQDLRKGLQLNGWSVDRLGRVWLLMQLNAEDRAKYVFTIENLFLNGEMSELVALYSSLPLLAYAESWKKRCAEGIRNNIGLVLESVICNNPYPAEQLDEAAWNQMVLKAIFTEKPMLAITGLQNRMNSNLALALTDYAHERWAAHRPVNPLLWICVAPYVSEGNFDDIRRLFSSEDPFEHQAAALVCHKNASEEARHLLDEHLELKAKVEREEITWSSVASAMSNDQG